MNESKSAPRSVSMKAKSSAGHGKRKASRMHITAADNGGFSVETEHEPDSDDMEKGTYTPPMKTVHEDTDSLMEHVGKQFGAKKNKASMAQASAGKTQATDAAKVDAAEQV